ncbi:hypothetical protein CEUSTIGMA_g10948.t1 [Chlamydomonas eustigma]|uniref:Uncharacterized protein n=1 Tax=Chlamydomonas eustigma TaxID=1157962 RepID=A0A250XKH3_9CHLO|nr:hypothetical protein CEUSTIGMA_g10948.t1 [Chlamydomonas eustigma]|eukprot:GAX83523.1 hypothetical protein CEUSTIGMA_g10948.t1 [Chlamydomonas eustigma]
MLSPEPADTVEDVGFYFKFLGGVQFVGHETLAITGHARVVQVASRYGLLFFVNGSDVYTAKTSNLLPMASKSAGTDSFEPLEPRRSCLSRMTDCMNPDSIHVSYDQLLVAVVCTHQIHIYSIPQLAKGQEPSSAFDVSPIRSLDVNNNTICSFSWCQHAEHSSSFLALCTDGRLYAGDLLAPDLRGVATDIKAAAWSASSSHFVYVTSSANLVFSQIEDMPLKLLSVQLSHPEIPAAELVVDTVSWVATNQIVLSAVRFYEESCEEAPDAFPILLAWPSSTSGSLPSQQEMKLATFTPYMVEDGCTPALEGPYLHTATVLPWSACLLSHRKSMDDHVQLIQLAKTDSGGAGGEGVVESPLEVMVTSDKTRIALPSGVDGADNFVVGLAVDYSYDTGPLPHPENPEAPDLVPTPLLIVCTSDGVFRFYCFGHIHRQDNLTTPPLPVPPHLPSKYLLKSTTAQQTVTASSSATALDLGPSQTASSGSSILNSFHAAIEAAAAKASLPDDDEVELESESCELEQSNEVKQHQGVTAAQEAGGSAATTTNAPRGESEDISSKAKTSHTGGVPDKIVSSEPAPTTIMFGAMPAFTGFGANISSDTTTRSHLFSSSSSGTGTATSGSGLFSGTTSIFGSGNTGSSVSSTSSGMIGASMSQHTSTGAEAGSTLSAEWPSAPAGLFGGSTASMFGSGTSGNLNTSVAAPQSMTYGNTPGFTTFGAAPAFQLPNSNAAVSALTTGGASSLSTEAVKASGFGLFAPPAAAMRPREETDVFKPADRFSGAKPGFLFTTTEDGVGYHKDPKQSASRAPALTASAAEEEDLPSSTKGTSDTDLAVQQGPAKASPAQPAPRPEIPEVPVPVPKLSDGLPEVANMEASFLKTLYEARKVTVAMQAELKFLLKPIPSELDADAKAALAAAMPAASRAAYGGVAASVMALREASRKIRAAHEKCRKEVQQLGEEGIPQIERQLVGLQLFQQEALGGSLAAKHARLPLEPDLAKRRTDILAQLLSIQECLVAIEEQTDIWEDHHQKQQQLKGLGGGGGGSVTGSKALRSSRTNPMTVLHDTINLQADTIKNLMAKIVDISDEMENLGIRKPGPESESSKVMERWGSGQDTGGYGAGAEYGALVEGDEVGYGVRPVSLHQRTPTPVSSGQGYYSYSSATTGQGPVRAPRISHLTSAPAQQHGSTYSTPLGRSQPAHLLSGDQVEWLTPVSSKTPPYSVHVKTPGENPNGGVRSVSKPSGQEVAALVNPIWAAISSKLKEVTCPGGKVRTTVVRRVHKRTVATPSVVQGLIHTSTTTDATTLMSPQEEEAFSAALSTPLLFTSNNVTGKTLPESQAAATKQPSAAAAAAAASRAEALSASAALSKEQKTKSETMGGMLGKATVASLPQEHAQTKTAVVVKQSSKSQPPVPSMAQMQAAKDLAAKGPAAAGSAKAASSQPPVPSMAQMQAAKDLAAKGPAAAGGAKAASSQPPVPSMAQVQAAKDLAANGAAAAAGVAKAASSQPPVPSMAQMQAAKDLAAKATAAAAAAPKSSLANSQPTFQLSQQSGASTPAAAPGTASTAASSQSGGLFSFSSSSAFFSSTPSSTQGFNTSVAASHSEATSTVAASNSEATSTAQAVASIATSFAAGSRSPDTSTQEASIPATTFPAFSLSSLSSASTTAPTPSPSAFSFGGLASSLGVTSTSAATGNLASAPATGFGSPTQSLAASSPASNPFSTTNAPFSATNPAASPFSATSTGTGGFFGGQAAPGGLFASSTTSGTAGVFGSQPAVSSPFGSSPGGLFGSQSGASPVGSTSGGLFGSQTGLSPFGSTSPFGGNTSQATASGSNSPFAPAGALSPLGTTPTTAAAAAPAFGSSLGGSNVFGGGSVFGAPTSFGSTAPVAPAFGQASTFGSGFGQPAGVPSAFGQPFGVGAGFGQSAAGIFSQAPTPPVAPSSGGFSQFGQAGNAFASFGQGGNAFSSFGQAASSGGAFVGAGGAAQSSPSSFGALGAMSGGAAPKPSPASGSMWAPRK